MYSDLYFRQKRTHLSTIAVVLVVVGLIGFGTFYFSSNSTPTRASKKTLVQKELVNVTSNQVGLFWQSEGKETGWVLFGEDPDTLNGTASDERGDSKSEFQLHYVLMKNLKPDTTYYYKVVSGNEVVTDLDGNPFTFKTPKTMPPISTAKPAYGKLALKAGEPAKDALIMIKAEGAYPLVTFTKMTGEWLVPMQYIVNKQTMNNTVLRASDVVKVEAYNDELERSLTDILVSKLSPVPQTLVLGNNYSFLEEDNVLPATTTRNIIEGSVGILFPKENAIIPGSKPIMKGAALPGKAVILELDSDPPFRFKTSANERGEWDVTVPKSLVPRTYTLILRTTDKDDKEIVITRVFTLLKSGEQVLGEATGTASMSPTVGISPTVEPTIEPTSTTAPSPTRSITTAPAEISTTVTATPSAMPATGGVYISPTPIPPVSGGNGLLYSVTAIGLMVIGAGALFML